MAAARRGAPSMPSMIARQPVTSEHVDDDRREAEVEAHFPDKRGRRRVSRASEGRAARGVSGIGQG